MSFVYSHFSIVCLIPLNNVYFYKLQMAIPDMQLIMIESNIYI